MSMCAHGALVKETAQEVTGASLKCKRWTCPDCAPMRRSGLKRLCRLGGPTKFLTLTVSTKEHPDPHDAAQKLVWAWRCLVKRIKRRYGYKHVPYIVVIERTKNGYPHLHILGRFGYVDHDWLSEQMDDLMKSPIVDIRKVNGQAQAAAYVSKYVGKDPHQFVGCKRYWRSQDWIEDREAWEIDREERRAGWRMVAFSLKTFEAHLLNRGYAIRWEHPDLLIGEPPD